MHELNKQFVALDARVFVMDNNILHLCLWYMLIYFAFIISYHHPYHYLILQMLGIHSTASMVIKDPAALAEHQIEFVKLLKK